MRCNGIGQNSLQLAVAANEPDGHMGVALARVGNPKVGSKVEVVQCIGQQHILRGTSQINGFEITACALLGVNPGSGCDVDSARSFQLYRAEDVALSYLLVKVLKE